MLNLLVIVAVVLLYSLGCAGYGVWVIQVLPLQKSNPSLGYWTTAFLLGQGILAAVLELLSLAGVFTPVPIVLLLAVGWAAILVFNRELPVTVVSILKDLVSGFRKQPLEWKVIIIISLLFFLYLTLQMFLPPISDGATFYMVQAKLIASTGQIQAVPSYEGLSAVGLQGEFHFAALLALNGEMAAKLFMLPITLAGIAMLIGIARLVGLHVKGQILIFVVIITSSAFTTVMADGKVDLFGAGVGLAAFYWGCKTDEGWGAVALCGLLTGFAVIAKFSYLVVLPIATFLLVVYGAYLYNRTSKTARGIFFALILYGFFAALPYIPNIAKNAVLFGEPLSPFISSSGQAVLDQSWFSPITTERIVMTYPFSLVFGRFAAQYGTLSPLLLLFLPLILFIPRSMSTGWNNKLIAVSVAGLVGVLVWLIVRPSVFAPRYIMATLLILIVPIAVGVTYAIEHSANFRVIHALVVMVTLATLLITIADPIGLLSLAIGNVRYALETTHIPCDKVISLTSCEIETWLNQNIETGKRVVMWDKLRYWLRTDLIQCVQRQGELNNLTGAASPEESWKLFYQSGFHYVVVDWWNQDKTLNIGQLPLWLHADQVFQYDHYFVYDVQPTTTQSPPTSTCVQTGTNRWAVQKLQ